MTITADAVVNVLAGADTPLSSSAVAKALKTSQTKKVVGVLTSLVRQETLERVGSQYRMRDAGSYDVPLATGRGTRRTLLPTDTQAIAAGERRKAAAKLASSRKDRPARKPGEYRASLTLSDEEKEEILRVPDDVFQTRTADKPVTKLEEIEQIVDENKARDQRIRDAIERLKCKASQQVEPVADMNSKIEILDVLGSTDEELWEVLKSVIADLRRLDALAV